jgi:hypothetical protein
MAIAAARTTHSRGATPKSRGCIDAKQLESTEDFVSSPLMKPGSIRACRPLFVIAFYVQKMDSTVEIHRDDDAFLRALRDGDKQVFSDLVEGWGGMMLRLALSHVQNRAIAEEVVQEAWLTVLRLLDRFEGRSSLRTWVLGIVVNLARSRARKERRNSSWRTCGRAAGHRTNRCAAARPLPGRTPFW